MSEYTQKKARNLIDTGSIIQIDELTYQARASDPKKSYILTNGSCECAGFRWRGDCSHVQAVKMLQDMMIHSERIRKVTHTG